MTSVISKPKLAVEKPSAILMSLQRVQEKELHTVSQNLANSQNPGYKTFILSSEESVYRTKENKKVSYVKTAGTFRDLSDGTVNMTRNPLDLGLSGNGYFMVQTPNGMRYTRNGRFTMDTEGCLITHAGHFVLDQNSSPITLPKGVSAFAVSRTGYMSIDGVDAGQIGVMTFDNDQALTLEGDSLLNSQQVGVLNLNPIVTQGGYEESNVSPINASIQLVEIMHHFEEAQKLIENYEELMRETMNARSQA